jgi:hypothetical protein
VCIYLVYIHLSLGLDLWKLNPSEQTLKTDFALNVSSISGYICRFFFVSLLSCELYIIGTDTCTKVHCLLWYRAELCLLVLYVS